jgi:hypothetical protein
MGEYNLNISQINWMRRSGLQGKKVVKTSEMVMTLNREICVKEHTLFLFRKKYGLRS